MNKYEAVVIIKPDLSEEERKVLLEQINEAMTKNNGKILQENIWSERRKFFFPIKKFLEGVYYLVIFNAAGPAVKELKHTYGLNESILRVLITKIE